MLRLSFGKHKGQLLANIPTGYLKWLASEEIHVKEVSAELARRKELAACGGWIEPGE